MVGHFKAATTTIPAARISGLYTAFEKLTIRATRRQPAFLLVGLFAAPVRFGLVAGLTKPGGNITGINIDVGFEIATKRLEVGFLASREVWDGPVGIDMREAAQQLGISLIGPLKAPLRKKNIGARQSIMMSDQSEPFRYMRLISELSRGNRARYRRKTGRARPACARLRRQPDLTRHRRSAANAVLTS
jgi:hypothetical protein